MIVKVEISPGELLDKITILEIKEERIPDKMKLGNIKVELEKLNKALQENFKSFSQVAHIKPELKSANEKLWELEDEIRDFERKKDFGNSFIEVARNIYKSNDKRCSLKREINHLLNATIIEEKSYRKY